MTDCCRFHCDYLQGRYVDGVSRPVARRSVQNSGLRENRACRVVEASEMKQNGESWYVSLDRGDHCPRRGQRLPSLTQEIRLQAQPPRQGVAERKQLHENDPKSGKQLHENDPKSGKQQPRPKDELKERYAVIDKRVQNTRTKEGSFIAPDTDYLLCSATSKPWIQSHDMSQRQIKSGFRNDKANKTSLPAVSPASCCPGNNANNSNRGVTAATGTINSNNNSPFPCYTNPCSTWNYSRREDPVLGPDQIDMLLALAISDGSGSDMVECCKSALMTSNVHNIIRNYLTAVKYRLYDCMDRIMSTIRKNFLCIAQSKEFLSLPLEFVMIFMEDSHLNVANELDMFTIALSWIDYNKQERISQAGCILNSVRYVYIEPEDIVRYVEPNIHLFLGPAGQAALVNMYRHRVLAQTNLPPEYKCQIPPRRCPVKTPDKTLIVSDRVPQEYKQTPGKYPAQTELATSQPQNQVPGQVYGSQVSGQATPSASQTQGQKLASNGQLSNQLTPTTSQTQGQKIVSNGQLSNQLTPTTSQTQGQKIVSNGQLSNQLTPTTSQTQGQKLASNGQLSNQLTPTTSQTMGQKLASNGQLSNQLTPTTSQTMGQQFVSNGQLSNQLTPTTSQTMGQKLASNGQLSNQLTPTTSQTQGLKIVSNSQLSNQLTPTTSQTMGQQFVSNGQLSNQLTPTTSQTQSEKLVSNGQDSNQLTPSTSETQSQQLGSNGQVLHLAPPRTPSITGILSPKGSRRKHRVTFDSSVPSSPETGPQSPSSAPPASPQSDRSNNWAQNSPHLVSLSNWNNHRMPSGEFQRVPYSRIGNMAGRTTYHGMGNMAAGTTYYDMGNMAMTVPFHGMKNIGTTTRSKANNSASDFPCAIGTGSNCYNMAANIWNDQCFDRTFIFQDQPLNSFTANDVNMTNDITATNWVLGPTWQHSQQNQTDRDVAWKTNHSVHGSLRRQETNPNHQPPQQIFKVVRSVTGPVIRVTHPGETSHPSDCHRMVAL